MKNFIFTLFMFLLVGSMTAQITKAKPKPHFGIKLSVGQVLAPNETTYVGNPFDYIFHKVNYEGSSAIKNVGIYYQQKFGWLYVRSELGYSQFEQRYNVQSFVQVQNPVESPVEKFHNIDFQVMAGVTKDNWRFGVGPVAHVMAGHSSELGFISGFQSKTRPITYGYKGGVGFDAGRVTLDVTYEVGFRRVGDHLYYTNRMARSENKAHSINFTVGVNIL